MSSVLAKVVLAGFLGPAAVVFVISYRHALRHWLRPAAPIPTAAVVARGANTSDRGAAGRQVHAIAIATAFASVSIMGLIAVALVVVLVAGTIAR